MAYTSTTVAPSSLSTQPWWPQLRTMIVEAYASKNHSVFPPTWTRLDDDPAKAAQGLAQELTDKGLFVVLFDAAGNPAACSGVLPFRGDHWISEVEDKANAKELLGSPTARASDSVATPSTDLTRDWETCCFCTHPSHRGKGLSHRLIDELEALIKPKGAERLISNYAVVETGEFWTRLGFEVIPGAGGMIKKGFKVDPDKEGLRADVHFKMGAKRL